MSWLSSTGNKHLGCYTKLTGCSGKTDRTLEPQRPVEYSKGLKLVSSTGCVRSTMTGRAGASTPPLVCEPLRQQDQTLNSVQPESGHFSSQSPVIGQNEPENTSFYNWPDAQPQSPVTTWPASDVFCETLSFLYRAPVAPSDSPHLPPSAKHNVYHLCACVLAYFPQPFSRVLALH